MPKWGTRTSYKSKVSFRYLSSQEGRISWYSQEARPRYLARLGGLGKTTTMTNRKTKSSGNTKINHVTKLQPAAVENFKIKT